ncbi:MAG TPA: CpcT/CpeT family chromophore lyase [Steroidobacteraceae bacterium]|jgi:hypothetical protein|nr:CpcT/CpeT family chromophore lyase [Steroidobacteraceae bacterium]
MGRLTLAAALPATLGLIAAASLLGGCASQEKLREEQLKQLLAWLPGRYEGGAQTESDTRRGLEPPHARIALVIVRVYTPRLGHHVLFAEETAADDPRRVMSERMLSFSVDDQRGILETVYTLREPLRWRDGQEHPELFTAVTAEDVLSARGCELAWKKAGEEFTATQDPKLCSEAARAVRTQPAAELTADLLVMGDYRFGKTR